MTQARAFFDRLNNEYLTVHRTKEELFWSTYMGTGDDHEGFARAEKDYKTFVSDPARLAAVRAELASTEPIEDDVRHGLLGWQALFEANIVDNDATAKLQAELIEMESSLFERRKSFTMHYVNEQGETVEASLGTLSTNIAVNPNEEARKSSYEELRRLEQWLLANGFLDVIGKRNEFARALGFRDYFDYKVRKNENMSPEELFAILDDFETRTVDALDRACKALAEEKGEDALLPYNLGYLIGGDVRRRFDPYMPFSKSVTRWVESFRRLGITFRGATMQLDLLDRKGKWENGFCHGPTPAYFDDAGKWAPGAINFTSNAIPTQVGSGSSGLATLFHEGGHAAHFANVTQNSPCFSQEYPPTSMAYAETQSMFCDSLLGDADWVKRYAFDASGSTVPDELIRESIEKGQPWRVRRERSMLVVPYFERSLYAMSDSERTAEAALALARQTEQTILRGVSARPLMSIPHLMNQESSAAYHGYLLAHMAVAQTRAYFQDKFGYLTDNPAIGPLLAKHYWAPGNSVDHNATLVSLTGRGFSADALAAQCNRTVDEVWKEEQEKIAAASTREYPTAFPISLDAVIRVVDGDEVICDNSVSDDAMGMAFEAWVDKRYSSNG